MRSRTADGRDGGLSPISMAPSRAVTARPKRVWSSARSSSTGSPAATRSPGRARKEDAVSAAAGVICLAKPGEAVQAGQPLLELRADEAERFGPALAALADAIVISDTPPPHVSPVIEYISPA